MPAALLGAMLLASSVLSASDDYENQRFVSPSGDFCVVIRTFDLVGDFERISSDEYWQRFDSEARFDEPEDSVGALYRIWPGGFRESIAEFDLELDEARDNILVTDDGYFITADTRCGSDKVLTIRGPDAAIVRTLRGSDVLTQNDIQWLCRGDDEIRFELRESLRMTFLTNGGRWDDPDADRHVIDIDLRTGKAPAPERDHCPAPLRITPVADDALPGSRTKDAEWLRSHELLGRAAVRVLPEYPDVARKARISGRVGVEIVVGVDGRVESASIIKPLPFGLDRAVQDAIVKWEFAPGESRVSGVIGFDFEIIRPPKLTKRAGRH